MALTTNIGQGNEQGFIVINNPDNPLKEYVIISLEDYKEGLNYEDYSKIYKPIISISPEKS
jgi:hypothetical protein